MQAARGSHPARLLTARNPSRILWPCRTPDRIVLMSRTQFAS